MISDAAFLESTELTYFVRHLITQLAPPTSTQSLKIDEATEFCEKYFEKIQSCHHVLGAEYSFICGCKYNRRALTFCLMESFDSLPLDDEITAIDYQQLIEMICPDMPRHIIYEAAYAVDSIAGTGNSTINNTINNTGNSTSSTNSGGGPITLPCKYYHGELRIAVFFHIIYDEWLKSLEAYYRDEGTSSLPINKVKAFIDHIRIHPSSPLNNMEQPPADAIESVFSNIIKARSSTSNPEVTFDGFCRYLFKSQLIAIDVCKKPSNAKTLLSSPPPPPPPPLPPTIVNATVAAAAAAAASNGNAPVAAMDNNSISASTTNPG